MVVGTQCQMDHWRLLVTSRWKGMYSVYSLCFDFEKKEHTVTDRMHIGGGHASISSSSSSSSSSHDYAHAHEQCISISLACNWRGLGFV